jgi:hypothetical protein
LRVAGAEGGEEETTTLGVRRYGVEELPRHVEPYVRD